MGIKHSVIKVKGEMGLATEWNADHEIDGDVDFNKFQAQNLVAHSGAIFPASPVAGQLFFRTDLTTLFVFDGDNWVAWIEAAAMYEYYNTNDDAKVDVYGVNWAAQTFTTGAVSTIEKVILRSVKLKLYKVLAPGTIYVSLKALDGANKPTGPDLSTGTIQAYSITEETAGGWYDVVMSPYELQKSTKYAIVLNVPGGNAANYICWRVDSAGATYPGGSKATSNDSGATWTLDAAADFMFEVWGTRVYELVWEVDGADLQMTTARPMDMRSQQIHNVLDPTAAQDAATKNYVDTNLPPIRTKDWADMPSTLLTGAFATIASVSVNGVGANDVVLISYDVQYLFQSYPGRAFAKVQRAGGDIPGTLSDQLSNDTTHGTVIENVSRFVYDTPGAGNHTYNFQATSLYANNYVNDGTFVVIVLKG